MLQYDPRICLWKNYRTWGCKSGDSGLWIHAASEWQSKRSEWLRATQTWSKEQCDVGRTYGKVLSPAKWPPRATESNCCWEDSLDAHWSRINIDALAFCPPLCTNCIQWTSNLCTALKIPWRSMGTDTNLAQFHNFGSVCYVLQPKNIEKSRGPITEVSVHGHWAFRRLHCAEPEYTSSIFGTNCEVLHGPFLSTEQLQTHGIARSLADDITRMSSNDPDWVPKWSDEEQV